MKEGILFPKKTFGGMPNHQWMLVITLPRYIALVTWWFKTNGCLDWEWHLWKRPSSLDYNMCHGILIMGPYKPLRNWVEFPIPYYEMESSWELIDPVAHIIQLLPNSQAKKPRKFRTIGYRIHEGFVKGISFHIFILYFRYLCSISGVYIQNMLKHLRYPLSF